MTGLGRAWTEFEEKVVRAIGRVSDAEGLYTNLDLPEGIALTEEGFFRKLIGLAIPTGGPRWAVQVGGTILH